MPRQAIRPVKRHNPSNVATLPPARPRSETAAQESKLPFTDKQVQFIKEWAAGESVKSAAHRAGYTDDGSFAYYFIKRPSVMARYEAEKKKYEESCDMTRKRVMDGLIEAAEMAKLMAEPASMVAAWREIGKMCGYYEPVQKKIDINLVGGKLAQLERLTDEELLKLISAPVALALENDSGEDD